MPTPREIALSLHPASVRIFLAEAMEGFPDDDAEWIFFAAQAVANNVIEAAFEKAVLDSKDKVNQFTKKIRNGVELSQNEAIISIAQKIDSELKLHTNDFEQKNIVAKRNFENINHWDTDGQKESYKSYKENRYDIFQIVFYMALVVFGMFILGAGYKLGLGA